MMPLNLNTTDQLWRIENLGGDWKGINNAGDWELKINVYRSDLNGRIGLYGWDGGHDNEEWMLREEAGQVTVDSIQYDGAAAVADMAIPPSHCPEIIIVGNTPGTNNHELTRSVITYRSFTQSESETTVQKYTQTFGVSGGIGKIVEVSESGSLEEVRSNTISLSDQQAAPETHTDKISTQITVPPGKTYSCYVVVHYGRVAVPYTAHLTFRSSNPNAAPVSFTSRGIFMGVNSTHSEIVIQDITSANRDQQFDVERRPISKALTA